MMSGDAGNAEMEYVTPSQHDMRRSRQVNADMANKLVKQEEDNKVEQKQRRVRQDMKNRQSILLTSFAPMKPIVVTKAISTQTDSEPLKTLATIETQTELVETCSTRMQTESVLTKDSTMQTASTLKSAAEVQTEKQACAE